GRVRGWPIAREGAQKLKEVSYLHAEAYPASELKHGPLALVGPDLPTVAVVPDDELRDKNVSTLGEIKARRGRILAVGHGTLDPRLADDVVEVPRNEPELDPILLSVPLQLLAYHAAVTLGNDVDKPRNLAKSVTGEGADPWQPPRPRPCPRGWVLPWKRSGTTSRLSGGCRGTPSGPTSPTSPRCSSMPPRPGPPPRRISASVRCGPGWPGSTAADMPAPRWPAAPRRSGRSPPSPMPVASSPPTPGRCSALRSSPPGFPRYSGRTRWPRCSKRPLRRRPSDPAAPRPARTRRWPCGIRRSSNCSTRPGSGSASCAGSTSATSTRNGGRSGCLARATGSERCRPVSRPSGR